MLRLIQHAELRPGRLGRLLLLIHLFLSPLLISTATDEAFEYPKAAWLLFTAILLAALGLATGIRRIVLAQPPRKLLETLVEKARAFCREPLALGVILFLISASASTAFSISPRVSWRGAPGSHDGLRTVLAYAVLFFATRAWCSSRKDARFLLAAAVGAGVLVSLYALVQFARIDPIFWASVSRLGGYVRPFSTLGHANHLATYLVMVLPIILYFAGEALSRSRKMLFSALTLAGVLAVFIVLATLSRGGLLALAVVLICWSSGWALLGKGRRVLGIAGCGLLVAAAGFSLAFALNPGDFFAGAMHRLHGFQEFGSRKQIWQISWAIFQDRPVLGCGLDTFPLAFGRKRTSDFAQTEWNMTPLRSHNEGLHILATQGLGGGAAVLVLTGGLLLAAWRAWRRSDTASKPLLLAILGGIVGFYVQCIFSFTVPGIGTLFVTLAAMLSRLARVTRSGDRATTAGGVTRSGDCATTAGSWAARLLPVGVWTGAALLVTAWVIVPTRASMACRLGEELLGEDPARALEYFERAVAYNPDDFYYWWKLGVAAQTAAKQAGAPAARQPFLLRGKAAFERALELVPIHANYHARLGRILAELARLKMAAPEQAFLEYDLALDYDRNAYYFADAANAALVLERLERAKLYTERGLAMYPQFGVIRAHLGYIACMEKRYADAVRILEEALASDWHDERNDYNFAARLLAETRTRLHGSSEAKPTGPPPAAWASSATSK